MTSVKKFINNITVQNSFPFINMSVYKLKGSLMSAVNQSKPREYRPLSPLFVNINVLDYLVCSNSLSKDQILFNIPFDAAILNMIKTIDPGVTFVNQKDDCTYFSKVTDQLNTDYSILLNSSSGTYEITPTDYTLKDKNDICKGFDSKNTKNLLFSRRLIPYMSKDSKIYRQGCLTATWHDNTI
ncbi:hypothetical protein HZS_5550 [Henneguya salminicola]|nr:hypothetical protein HZS_5550 [Henneguya salminicola]